MYSILIILSLYFFAAAGGISTVFGHLGLALLSLYGLYYSSRYALFWFLLLLVPLATELRFSLEYYLWAAGLVGLALSPKWLQVSQRKREITLAVAFIIFAIADFTKITFSERGSLMIWLPVWLATISTLRSIYVEPFAAAAMFISNKKAALLAYLVHLAQLIVLKSRKLVLLLLPLVIALGYWISQHPKFLNNFLNKSILSRLHIWQSVFAGFLDRPLLGHGFGTFAIDFPPYRQHADVLGGHMAEHVAHGHNVALHMMFEQGLVGLALYLLLVYFIWRNCRQALLPFLVISICDGSLVSSNQYLLAALILSPSMGIATATQPAVSEANLSPRDDMAAALRAQRSNLLVAAWGSFASLRMTAAALRMTVLVIATIFQTLSVTAHYYYDRGNYSQAIQLDPYHSLYRFMRGASNLHLQAAISEQDLKRAVELSPHVSYFYGFLAAAHLANVADLSPRSEDPRLKLASQAINTAIRYDGSDPYWHTLSSFIHYQNPELAKREMQLALKRNPEIEQLLHDPSITATEYIGSRKSDVRITSFYRRGAKVFLPLPYV